MAEAPPPVWYRGPYGRATLFLIALRVLYAYNWFDIGPGLPAIGTEFGVGAFDWGLLLAVFFTGAGVLGVPAGVLADRWGNRRVALVGAGILGTATLASGLAPDFVTLLALRALGGAGAGLFFSPAIALVSEFHSEGRRGVPVGVFSSAYSAGAGIGVFLAALLVPDVGWRITLILGGAALLVATLAIAPAIPVPGRAQRDPSLGSGHAGRVWRSPAVWVMGLSFIGLEGASLSAGQYFVPFAEIVRGWAPALAGAIGSLLVLPSFFGGPLGGHLAERYRNRRTQMAVFTAVPAVLLALVPLVGIVETAAIAAFFSVGYGMVYAMMYVGTAFLPGIEAGDLALAIGLFNSIQLAGGAVIALLVGGLIEAYGYTVGWWVLSAGILVTLVLLPLLPRSRGSRSPSTGPA
jgi:MFS transporter, DHA1 family, inner membrane transport protein